MRDWMDGIPIMFRIRSEMASFTLEDTHPIKNTGNEAGT